MCPFLCLIQKDCFKNIELQSLSSLLYFILKKKTKNGTRFSHDGTWSMLMVLRFPFFPYQWIFVIIQNRIMYSQQLHMSFWSWNNPSINIVFVSCPKKKKNTTFWQQLHVFKNTYLPSFVCFISNNKNKITFWPRWHAINNQLYKSICVTKKIGSCFGHDGTCPFGV